MAAATERASTASSRTLTAQGCIIGVPISRPGVILYDAAPLGLCMGMTQASFAMTTEFYPDSPRTTPAVCIEAQMAAVSGALAFTVS